MYVSVQPFAHTPKNMMAHTQRLAEMDEWQVSFYSSVAARKATNGLVWCGAAVQLKTFIILWHFAHAVIAFAIWRCTTDGLDRFEYVLSKPFAIRILFASTCECGVDAMTMQCNWRMAAVHLIQFICATKRFKQLLYSQHSHECAVQMENLIEMHFIWHSPSTAHTQRDINPLPCRLVNGLNNSERIYFNDADMNPQRWLANISMYSQ